MVVLVYDEVFAGVGEKEMVKCLDDLALLGCIVGDAVVRSKVHEKLLKENRLVLDAGGDSIFHVFFGYVGELVFECFVYVFVGEYVSVFDWVSCSFLVVVPYCPELCQVGV